MILWNGKLHVAKSNDTFRIVCNILKTNPHAFDFLRGCKLVLLKGITGYICDESSIPNHVGHIYSNPVVDHTADFPCTFWYSTDYEHGNKLSLCLYGNLLSKDFNTYDSAKVTVFCDIAKFPKELTFVEVK